MKADSIALAALRPLALIGILAGTLVTVADPDLWGHVRFGLDILESGRVTPPTVDPYSFTADRPFLYHEWLGGTLMAVSYRTGGGVGLQVLKAAIVLVLFGLLWLSLRRAAFGWRWAALALAAFGTLPMLLTIRPQLWSGIGVLVIVRIITATTARVLILLPVTFAVWANLHGGWIVGGAIVAIVTAVALVQRDERRWLLLVAGAASFAATLATPFGTDLWAFLAETVRLGRADVAEWQPIWRLGPDSIALWLATVAFAAITMWRFRVGARDVAVIAVFAFAAARVDRLGPLFTLATVALLSGCFPPQPDGALDRRTSVALGVIDALALGVALVAMFAIDLARPCIALTPSVSPDTRAAEALRGRTGRLATFFDFGEYALWQFGPALQVSTDGRRETVYHDATFRAHLGVVNGTPSGLQTLESMNVDYAWLPAWSPARPWLESNGYRIDVMTDRSFVASRMDRPPLSPWLGESSGCFPGP